METGTWEIKENHLYMLSSDGNEIAKYKLYDKGGSPTNTNVFKRKLQTMADIAPV